MHRRDFLKSIVVWSLQASAPAVLSACGSRNGETQERAVSADFPQGVASADPASDSVVLWTRALPREAGLERFALRVEVAEDEAFARLVLRETVRAEAAQDFTVHARITGLRPDTIYYYRFVSLTGDVSITGRTWTAPAEGLLAPLTLAFVSCQERKHGYYGAWRRMLKDDRVAPRERQIRFVLHLGDFIYETDESWQAPLDEHFDRIPGGLLEPSGEPRDIGEFPDGAVSASGVLHAETVADYRHLYRRYLSDPDLLAARARWPFVCIWDDHEFSDDCWQSEANYDNHGAGATTDEPSQRRKVAANQAWSEYIPVDYAGAEQAGEPARPFRFVDVENTPNDRPNADNDKAIASLTINRRLRFGQLFDLVLTDNRSYRSDHAMPEDISGGGGVFIHPRAAMPLHLLNQLDAGNMANDGNPRAYLGIGGVVFANPRRHSPPGSILGERQKQWWKRKMTESTARWRLWGNSVPLMRFKVNLQALDDILPEIVLSSDSWDGYAHERRELMRHLRDNGIGNVVSLSGDVHAHFAGTVFDDYDAQNPEPAAVEVVTAAISSLSMFAGVERMSRRDRPTALEAAVRSLITYPDPDDPTRQIRNLDNSLLNGVEAGLAAAAGKSAEEVAAARNPTVNPHLLHADTAAHGYGVATVTKDEMTVRLVTVETITDNARADRVESVVTFSIPHRENGGAPTIRKL